MHSVGREETQKALTPTALESLTPSEVNSIVKADIPRPKRRHASRALKALNAKKGQNFSLSKAELKGIFGDYYAVDNGMRGALVTDSMMGLDSCQEVLTAMKDVVLTEADPDRKIRAARAAGDVVGRLSSLLKQTAELQDQINEGTRKQPQRTNAPPSLTQHNYGEGVTIVQNQSASPSPRQPETAKDSSTSPMPNPLSEPHNTASDSSMSESSGSALPQERSRPLQRAEVSPLEPDGIASHGEPQPSHASPPWEESDAEF